MNEEEAKKWKEQFDSDPATRLAITWVALVQHYDLDAEGGGELVQMFEMVVRMGGYSTGELYGLLRVSLRAIALLHKIVGQDALGTEMMKDLLKQGFGSENN